MEISTLLMILALTIASAAFLARPFLDPQSIQQDTGIVSARLKLQETRRQLEELARNIDSEEASQNLFQEKQEELLSRQAAQKEQLESLLLHDPVEQAVEKVRSELLLNQSAQVFCSRCGKALEPWHRFCPFCGEAARSGEQTSS